MKTPYSEVDNKEVQRYVKKIIKILRNPPSDFPTFILKKHLRGCSGIIDYDSITLAVYWDIVPTIWHEVIHYMHDDWKEARVLKYDKMIKRYIKLKDVITLIKLFANLI